MKNLSKSELIETIELHKKQIKKLEECLESRATTIEVPAHNFEVYHKDALPSLKHDEAMKYCGRLDGGWRLPTREEQVEMYKHKESLGLEDTAYWSSTLFNSNTAWLCDFGFGYSNVTNKSSAYRVRAVRTIK